MKKLLLFILGIGLCLSYPTFAKSSEDVKWQVNIEIQYNAVDRKEATKIISRVMEQNETACKVGAKIKKVTSETDDFIMIDSVVGSSDSRILIQNR